MVTIHKFALAPEHGAQHVEMPMGAQLLSVAVQQGVGLVLWARVEPDAPKHNRRLFVAYTGQELPSQLSQSKFVGTIAVGPLVCHVFDFAEAEPS